MRLWSICQIGWHKFCYDNSKVVGSNPIFFKWDVLISLLHKVRNQDNNGSRNGSESSNVVWQIGTRASRLRVGMEYWSKYQKVFRDGKTWANYKKIELNPENSGLTKKISQNTLNTGSYVTAANSIP